MGCSQDSATTTTLSQLLAPLPLVAAAATMLALAVLLKKTRLKKKRRRKSLKIWVAVAWVCSETKMVVMAHTRYLSPVRLAATGILINWVLGFERLQLVDAIVPILCQRK